MGNIGTIQETTRCSLEARASRDPVKRIAYSMIGIAARALYPANWAFNIDIGQGMPTHADFILRFNSFSDFQQIAPVIRAVVDAGYHVEQSLHSIQQSEFLFQVGSMSNPSTPRIQVNPALANVMPHHDQVIRFFGDATARWVSGGSRPVLSPTCSQAAGGAWSWNLAGSAPALVGFDTWLSHYYPQAQGGLPSGMSRAQALMIFVQGQFPTGNRIGLTQAEWNALPAP